ncbi:MAG: radical SAM protein [Planctomycetota bacterium]|jgi:radical SAM superfamily enzyme YgiQ (UPF0313 family)
MATPRILVRTDSQVLSTDGGEVITFDRAGRLYSAFVDGRFYRRGVDGRMVAKYTDDEGIKLRHRLGATQARRIQERALALARQVPGAAERNLMRDLDADAARFRQVYAGSVPILPPDVYRSLVLQATVGCAYNACRFCHLYADRPFRVRGEEEFARHARDVAAAFGAGLSMRRGVFLGDADALFVETPLLERFWAVARELPPAGDGFTCFGHPRAETTRDAGEGEALRAAGLRRVYLGIETGHDPLRRRLNKPGTSADTLRLTRALKAAGISVGLIFLLGAGGDALAEDHVRDSGALVRAADLDAGDFVYLSPLVRPDGHMAKGAALQETTMREAMGEGPRVAVYDIRAFIY